MGDTESSKGVEGSFKLSQNDRLETRHFSIAMMA